MTVHEVSGIAGVSIRTLQYYDRIGLLPPSGRTDAGYRTYGETDLERLQQILLFRELGFPLRDIRRIVNDPGFDRNKALTQQIELLELKKEHLENLILLARGIRAMGVRKMSFDAFDTKKIDEYAARAKASWGNTPAYREFEEKTKNRTDAETRSISAEMMGIFAEFGAVRDTDPASEEAQSLVRKLQGFITEHFYACTDEILRGLGKMYAAGGEFTRNIDAAGGEGTAAFVDRAIGIRCGEERR